MKLKKRLLEMMNAPLQGNGIETTREILFESVVLILCILGFFAVIMGGVEVFLQGKPAVVLIYVCTYLPALACLVLKRRIRYRVRVGILLADLYLLSVLVLGGVGLSGAGINLLVTFCVLSTTFLGIRAGLFSILAGILAIVTVGGAISSGVVPADAIAMINSFRIEAWLTAAVLFSVVGGIMVICPGVLQNSLQQIIEIVREKTGALEKSNQRLQKALEERQEMEARLVRTEKMEAIGLLAGGVAHDLNNILSGVTTYPESLLYDMSPEDPCYEHLTMIKASGDKAAAIVRDLLTLSRRGVKSKQILDFSRLIRDGLKSPEVKRIFQFHPRVSVSVNISPLLSHIEGSPVHISNVFMNLVSNAAEAMPGGGRIHISAENVLLEKECHGYETIPEGEWVRLSVADTGTGISESDLARLFEPFFTKKKMGRSGTGLGMAIVYGSVKDHGGYIDIHTELGSGTEISLYFPVSAEPAMADANAFDIEKMQGEGQSVLFVDDVKEQREIGRKVLSYLGYKPVCVESGQAAVAWCEANQPDLLALDMIMEPGIDGYETLKRIRHIYPDLGAVILSGFSETDRVKSALGMGRAVFLEKPYNLEDFASALFRAKNFTRR